MYGLTMRLKGVLTQKLTPLQSLLVRRWRPQWVCTKCRSRSAWQRALATNATVGQDEKPYYATTPIFYVNAAPHVGHMYTMVLTDVMKRWQVLKGRKAILCTGTDEHGMKIQQAAARADSDPKSFCDKGAEVFKALAASVNISNDHFVRTTDPAHKEAVEYAWHLLQERGYIYQAKHEGWYSVSDETYYTESSVRLTLDPSTGRKYMASNETGKEVEWTSEQNYHFRLSAFRQPLLDFYQQNPEWIKPLSRMREVIASVESGLQDLSISRPSDRLTWGIRVPTDDSQTIYVWLDALLNYVTKVGYPWAPGAESVGGWPADVQVIGKDIVRFHCIYWPAFLMALSLAPPKQIMTHAHWTLGKQKMAKSTGNVVNPFFALDRFGIDPLRYFLVHNGGMRDDAEYDNRLVARRYTHTLKNGLGNLAARTLLGRDFDIRRAVKQCRLDQACQEFQYDVFDKDSSRSDIDSNWSSLLSYKSQLAALPARVDRQMQELAPNRALQAISAQIDNANAFIQWQRPWEVGKMLHVANSSKGQEQTKQVAEVAALERRLDCIIFSAVETLRVLGIMLQPFMPGKANELLDVLGVDKNNRSWHHVQLGADRAYGKAKVERHEIVDLFPRLESAD